MTTKQKTGLSIAGASFESLKEANEHGAEYWSACGLQPQVVHHGIRTAIIFYGIESGKRMQAWPVDNY